MAEDTLFENVRLLVSGSRPAAFTASNLLYKFPFNMGAFAIREIDTGAIGTSLTSVTTQSKYYGRALDFATSYGTAFSIAYTTMHTNSWLFATEGYSYCAEGWFYVSSLGADRVLFCLGGSNVSYRRSVVVLQDGTLVGALFGSNASTPAATISSSAGSISTNQWYHIAFARDVSTNTYTLYLNGAVVGSTVRSEGDALPYGFVLGYGTYSGATRYALSYVNDFRVTIGTPRYTGTFTPPGALCGTISGIILDANGDPFRTTVMAVPRLNHGVVFDTPSLAPLSFYTPNVWSTISSASDGSFSLEVPNAELSVVYMAPDGGETLYNDKVHRIIAG